MENEIKSLISEVLRVKRNLITNSLSIGEIPEWDSMGNLNIIQAIEAKFQIDIPMEDLFELTSVKSIIEEVEKLKNA